MLAEILAYNKSALCQNASPAFSFVLLIDSFLARRGYFFPRDLLNQLEISALTECELKRFSRAFQGSTPSPLACLPVPHPFFLAPSSSKRLQACFLKGSNFIAFAFVNHSDHLLG